MNVNMTSLVLLDIKGLLMHSYHRGVDHDAILQPDNTAVNTFSYGLRGFLEFYLEPILREHAPLNIVAVWDGGNEYRKGLFAGYKAKRHAREKNQPQDAQLDQLYKAAKALLAYAGCWNVHVEGVEADDLIALFHQRFPDVPKFIHTVDQDIGQLTDAMTVVLHKGEPMEDFEGHPLKHIRVYKSLVGDSSDEYGGVPQVGPAAFRCLVDNFGYDGIDEIEQCVAKGQYQPLRDALAETEDKAARSVLAKILDNLHVWKLMYNLAGLHPDLCYRATTANGGKIIRPAWYCRMPNAARLQEIMGMAKVRDLYDGLFAKYMPTQELFDASELNLHDIGQLHELANEAPFFPFDYETYDSLGKDWSLALPDSAKGDHVDVLSARLAGASFTVGSNLQHTFYMPIAHRDTANVDLSVWRGFLMKRHREQLLLAHNASFEEQVTKLNLDFTPEGIADSMIWSSYVDENEFMGLKDNSLLYFHYTQETFKALMEKCGAKDMRDLTGDQVLSYGCDDAFCTARLGVLFWMILKLEQQWDFVFEKDRLTVHPISHAFEQGTRIDFERMRELQAADAETVRSGMESIRALLTEHCSEVNEAGSLALAKADLDNLRQIMRHTRGDKLSKEQIEAKLEETRLRWIESSRYNPYSERFEPWEFIPTPTVLTSMAYRVGCRWPIEKNSKKFISEWLSNATVEPLPEAPHSEKRAQFLDLLGSAAHQLNKREGDEYHALKQFCEDVLMKGEGRTIQEGDELNLGSPDQMRELLYCKLAFPVRLRTMPQRDSTRQVLGLEGSPGTDEEAIQMAIAEDTAPDSWKRELLKTLLSVKEAMTRESLFYRKYPHWQHPRDGLIHPAIKNCGTATRRPTGSSPNILQVSKGDLRSIYVPRDVTPVETSAVAWLRPFDLHIPKLPKQVIVATDFSGQELRIFGSEARDPVMIDAYTGLGTYEDDGMTRTRTRDIHSVTGCTFARRVIAQEMNQQVLNSLIFDESGVMDYEQFRHFLSGALEEFQGFAPDKLAKVVNQVRKMAKVVNFLIIYGGTAFTLAMKLGVPEAFADMLMKLVFTGYPRMAPWQEEVVEEACKYGFITTAYGTRKHCSKDLVGRDRSARRRAERQTVNHKIQACAADILKVVLTAAHEEELFYRNGAVMIAPVYDEIVSTVPIERLPEFINHQQRLMNVTPPGHPIPMMAEVSIGKDWHDTSNYELGDWPSDRKIEAALSKMFEPKVTA